MSKNRAVVADSVSTRGFRRRLANVAVHCSRLPDDRDSDPDITVWLYCAFVHLMRNRQYLLMSALRGSTVMGSLWWFASLSSMAGSRPGQNERQNSYTEKREGNSNAPVTDR
jgi:hypothetical protein